ncbi:methyltransferase [Bacillus sp. FJAT-49736]|uniref:methyltransferase n=1 Tax=Bacillus sp. FJAT-49736 TaxID=2833582 RepID=UPI001BC90446|nr:methyltransferase [Bacillus sp. FJAT-49736]MBS4175578.1 class I SAM-dependent methyltransferase [Bacillus sp. FJAT-49736]
MKDKYFDALLNIKTREEQKGFLKSMHYHRYEPTPYEALETLFQEYELTSKDRIVDFGCGKGRLNFYIHHFFHAAVTGIEMNERFIRDAMANRESYLKRNLHGSNKIHFHCCLAEDYEINPRDNRFYFFNPFSVQIFMKVVNHILQSVEKMQRVVDLILYYPSNEYVYFLENQTSFTLLQEVLLPDLFEQNPNERFLIYRLDW